jgi:molybdopterin converting factor small subunit
VLDQARQRYGSAFEAVLTTCRIWVNGEPAGPTDRIGATDELAVLPPVSGG